VTLKWLTLNDPGTPFFCYNLFSSSVWQDFSTLLSKTVKTAMWRRIKILSYRQRQKCSPRILVSNDSLCEYSTGFSRNPLHYLSYYWQTVTDFHNCFTARLGRKLMCHKTLLNFLPQLKSVATLHCKILFLLNCANRCTFCAELTFCSRYHSFNANSNQEFSRVCCRSVWFAGDQSLISDIQQQLFERHISCMPCNCICLLRLSTSVFIACLFCRLSRI